MARITRAFTRAGFNGARGEFLATGGVLYCALGLSYLFLPARATIRETMSYQPVILPLFGVAWLAAGVTGLFASRMPIGTDRFGFALMSGVPWAWAVAYLIGWATGNDPRGWVGAIVFVIFGRMVALSAHSMQGHRLPPKGSVPGSDGSGP